MQFARRRSVQVLGRESYRAYTDRCVVGVYQFYAGKGLAVILNIMDEELDCTGLR